MKHKVHHIHFVGMGGATQAGRSACRRQAVGATGREGRRAAGPKADTGGRL